MKKEALTLENVKKDLRLVARLQMEKRADWRFTYICPATVLAVLAGLLLQSIVAGLLIFTFAAYHIVKYVCDVRAYREKRRAIDDIIERGDISVSTETLTHIATDTVYEPHTNILGAKAYAHATREVTIFHFAAGGSWRLPTLDDGQKHYAWSTEYYLSRAGLLNTSVAGNEFFRVSLQGHYEISYIYPCKFFVLGADLTKEP